MGRDIYVQAYLGAGGGNDMARIFKIQEGGATVSSVISVKNAVLIGVSAVGTVISQAFGGWDSVLTTLCIFMAVDYFSGLVVAMVFKNSDKSESGALDSKAGFKGICKKGVMLAVVILASRLDIMFGDGAVYRTAVTLFFISNEGLSVLENFALMGVEYPKVLKDALEVMKQRTDNR